MKFLNSQRLVSVRGWTRAGMAAGICCGVLAFSSPGDVQAQDNPDQIEDRLRPGNAEDVPGQPSLEDDDAEAAEEQFRQRTEEALNGRPSPPDVGSQRQLGPDPTLGQPYYRDVQGRFFFLDPTGGRVYIEIQRPGVGAEWQMRQPQAPQGPELGVIITPSPEGIRVDQVQGASVAAEAGLQPGDVLQQFNGQPINDPRQLQQLVRSMSAGQSAELTVLRNGEEQTLTATFPEETEGQRYEASKPAMDGSELQQEIKQLRSEVDALRQQMNQLRRQGTGDGELSPPQPLGQGADLEASGRVTETEELEAEARQAEEEAAAARARSEQNLDLSTEEDDPEAEADAEPFGSDPFGGDADDDPNF